jgi:hypothetical protein
VWLAAPALLALLGVFRRELRGALTGPGSPTLLLGLALGGLLTHGLTGRLTLDLAAPIWDQHAWSAPWARLAVFLLAGLLIGFGGRALGPLSRGRGLLTLLVAAASANLLYGLLMSLVGS